MVPLPSSANAFPTAPYREEEDEETKEWEQEQLRRGGLRAESIEPVAKPVYKPAPSTLISHLVESWY